MRKLTLVGAAAAALVAASASGASAGAWCAWYDAYTYNCGFRTFQQCLDTISGNGGTCARNVQEPWTDRDDRRRRHR